MSPRSVCVLVIPSIILSSITTDSSRTDTDTHTVVTAVRMKPDFLRFGEAAGAFSTTPVLRGVGYRSRWTRVRPRPISCASSDARAGFRRLARDRVNEKVRKRANYCQRRTDGGFIVHALVVCSEFLETIDASPSCASSHNRYMKVPLLLRCYANKSTAVSWEVLRFQTRLVCSLITPYGVNAAVSNRDVDCNSPTCCDHILPLNARRVQDKIMSDTNG